MAGAESGLDKEDAAVFWKEFLKFELPLTPVSSRRGERGKADGYGLKQRSFGAGSGDGIRMGRGVRIAKALVHSRSGRESRGS